MPDDKIINVLDKGFVKLVDHMGNDSSIAKSARVSYAKGTKSVQDDENLIRYLWRNKHTSPFEMVTFTFHVKLPIFVSNQWVRHRTWSFNQISGRYSEMPDEFYVPEENKITKQNPNNKQGGTDDYIGLQQTRGFRVIKRTLQWFEMFKKEQSNARNQYEEYLSTGMRRELARINLPLSQYTEMYATVDLHNLLHFLRLRIDHHAQYEIRVYAEAILELIKEIVPVTAKAFEDYTLNSMTLSGIEIEALRTLLQPLDDENCASIIDAQDVRDKFFSNKRESSEFASKVKRLLYK